MTSSLNSTSAALLGLLHERAMTGGELVAAAQERLGSFWTLTRSQVYRELPALAAAGYVRLGKVGARAAQPYAVSAAGKRAFSSWLSQPVGPDYSRNPVLLRLGFGMHHDGAQLSALVAAAKSEHQEALQRHRSTLAELKKDGGDRFALASTEFGVAYEKAILKWLDTVPLG